MTTALISQALSGRPAYGQAYAEIALLEKADWRTHRAIKNLRLP